MRRRAWSREISCAQQNGQDTLEAVSPVEIVIDLPRPDQILQLFEPGEAGMIKQLWRKINSLEQGAELFRPFLHIPFAAEARQMPRNLGKRDAITAIVG